MKRQVIFGTMLSASLAVGLGAQQPQAGQPTGASGSPSQNAAHDGQTVTVTGCLQPGAQTGAKPGGSPTGAETPAAAQRAQGDGGYILTSVAAAGSMTGASGSSAGAVASGTSGSASGGASTPGGSGFSAGSGRPSNYRLVGGDNQNLQQYVGQRVEVTGTVMGRQGPAGSGSNTGTGTSSPSGTATGSPGGSATGAGAASGTGSNTSATAGSSSSGTTPSTGAQSQGGTSPSLRVTSIRPATAGGNCSQ